MKDYRALSVILLSLVLASPLAAAPRPVSEEAFLRSLAQSAEPTVEPAVEEPLAGVGIPEPALKACNVSRPCGDGNTAACSGISSCVYSQKGVKCDGVEHACPNYCSMGWTCAECPGYVHFCWSLSGDCGVTNDGCNGQPQRCLCPEQPQWP